MKKILAIAVFTLLAGIANAQETTGQKVKHAAKKTGHAVKRAGKKVGHEAAEVGSKGVARVKDNVYKDKVGPNGETIYIDDHSKYYRIDEKGHHVYVAESDLRNK